MTRNMLAGLQAYLPAAAQKGLLDWYLDPCLMASGVQRENLAAGMHISSAMRSCQCFVGRRVDVSRSAPRVGACPHCPFPLCGAGSTAAWLAIFPFLGQARCPFLRVSLSFSLSPRNPETAFRPDRILGLWLTGRVTSYLHPLARFLARSTSARHGLFGIQAVYLSTTRIYSTYNPGLDRVLGSHIGYKGSSKGGMLSWFHSKS